jgi:hypothetical protein
MKLIHQSNNVITIIPHTAMDHNFVNYLSSLIEARIAILKTDLGSKYAVKFQLPIRESQF